MRRIGLLIGLLLFMLIPVWAQDGLNLPTELYVLLNEGKVERYGLGVAGVQHVSPSASFVLDFGVAPDGNWLAYRTPDGLFLSNMFSVENQQLEGQRASVPNIRGQGNTLVWSPGSDALAYTTEYGGRVAFLAENAFSDLLTPGLLHLSWSPDGNYLAAEALEGVWWIFRRQGSEMVLTAALPGAYGADWINSSRLVYAPIEGGITIIDLSAGNYPTVIADASQTYHQPYVMDDGRIRAFSGESSLARLVEIAGTVASPQMTEIGTGDVDLTGVRWAPGGNLLVAFQGGALALLDPASGGGFTLPIAGAAAYGWGPTYPAAATGVQLPSDGYFISLDNSGIVQVWRLPADGTLPVTVTPSTHDITEFAVSPDASRIVYVSNGSLWAYALRSEAPPVKLAELGVTDGVSPAWSPDSSTVYYRDRQDSGGGIWRNNLDALELTRFLGDTDTLTYSNPRLASGVAAMVVTANEELMLVDTVSGAQNGLGILGEATWMAATELLAQGNSIRGPMTGNGLFAYDANQVEADPVLIMPLLGDLRLLDYQALNGNFVRALVQNRTPGVVQVLDVSRDGSTPAFVGTAGYMVNPQLSPDGSAIVGYTSPGGTLIVHDITTGQSTLIDTLPQVSAFVWQR